MAETPIRTVDELVALVGTPLPRVVGKTRAALHDLDRQWLAASPFCLVATADENGACDVSPKGDPPGQLAHVIDDTTIAIAERPGNRRVDGYRNVLANPHVGLIFLLPAAATGCGSTAAGWCPTRPSSTTWSSRGTGRSWRWWWRSRRPSTTVRRPSCGPRCGSRKPGPTTCPGGP